MRTVATVALSLFFVSAFSQAPVYSRITLDPTVTVPSGDLFCLDVAPTGGNSLFISNAGNLSRDAGYGSQFYIANAAGESERIPMEKVGLLVNRIDSGEARLYFSKISPRGGSALVQSGGFLVSYKREGKVVRRVRDANYAIGFTSETSALVVAVKAPSTSSLFFGAWNELSRYDLETGTMTPLTLPVPAVDISEIRLVNKGRTLVYQSATGFERIHLGTGAHASFTLPAGSYGYAVDQEGKSIYSIRKDFDDAVVERTSLANGEVTEAGRITGAREFVYLSDAVGGRVLVTTGLGLVPEDTGNGWDAYLLDTDADTLSLVSRMPDGSAVDDLPGYTQFAYLTPDGGSAIYRSKRNDLVAPASPAWGHPFQRSYRQAVGGPAEWIAKPVTGGGANLAELAGLAVSKNGNSVLYAAREPGSLRAIRLLVRGAADQVAARIVNTSVNSMTPLAVTDDARYSLYRLSADPGNGQAIHLWTHDGQTGVTKCVTRSFVGGIGSTTGKVDEEGRVYFIADATGKVPGISGARLFRFDPSTETLTPLAVADANRPIVEVGGGRVAFTRSFGQDYVVYVLDGTTGTVRRQISLPDTSVGALQLTNGRRTIGISTDFPDGPTLIYDLYTGSEIARGPGGGLSASGEWILGDRKATYLATGATFPMLPQIAGLGAPIGPVAFDSMQSGNIFFGANDRGHDLVRYRVSVPSTPVAYATYVTLVPGGARIHADLVPAGLQGAETWVEARFDGGTWQRLTLDGSGLATISSTDGAKTLDLRANDALGRTSSIETFRVNVDSVAPAVSAVSTTVVDTTVTVRFTVGEASSAQVIFGLTALNSVVNGGYVTPGTHEIKLTGLQANKTYKFRVRAADAASNIGASEELTFTTGG